MNRQETHAIEMMAEQKKSGGITLGPYSSDCVRNDAKRLFFALARYKFCSKMLAGKHYVLEVGCGDGFGISLMVQTCVKVLGIDIEDEVINYNRDHNRYQDQVEYKTLNIIDEPLGLAQFDAAYSLDVLEHIDPDHEEIFIKRIAQALKENAPCIIGTPNITASDYASAPSLRWHINLKSHDTLMATLSPHFHNVFIFSMNDEIVHTGFYPLAHYLIALAVGPKR